jgi:predicted Zn-dependent protease with MMP-like domain
LKLESFEKLVEEAVASLPQEFKVRLKNIAILVEMRASPEILRSLGMTHPNQLLGLFHGVPYRHQGPISGNLPPVVISVYQEPIENISRSEEEMRDKVRDVVIHEIAHYFGFDDDYLKQIEEKD